MTTEFIVESDSMKKVLSYVDKIGDSDGAVFIGGETGVGKELVAKYIHKSGNRSKKPFESVNCGALPEGLLESELFGHRKGAFTGALYEKKGLFETAEKGVLFLDEFTAIGGRGYNNLLRVMSGDGFNRVGSTDTISPDVRIVAASSSQEKISKDLHYRFTYGVTVPPLRERKDDILPLINYFLKRNMDNGGEYSKLPSEKRDALLEYSWPGNVRQLEGVIERYSVLGEIDFREYDEGHDSLGVISNEFLNESRRRGVKFSDIPNLAKDGAYRFILNHLLNEEGHDQNEAADILGISVASITRKIRNLKEKGYKI